MDAIELLKQDHARVMELFNRVRNADLTQKRHLFQAIRLELERHTLIEETVFYPAFAEKELLRERVQRSLDDHQEVKDLISQLETADDDDDFDGLLEDLVESVEHHVLEEENDFFPDARTLYSERELAFLGDKLEEARERDLKAA